VLAALCWVGLAWALAAQIVMEIDAPAERMLDARSARRLVALELADVDVPSTSAGVQPALFFRVLGRQGGLVRVELWERGELHDARVVSSSEGSGQLVARRVALAAAELARDLRQRRIAQRRREERERARAAARAKLEAERTREGPLALRSSVGAVRSEELVLVGSSLVGELSLRGPVRFDIGGRLLLGQDDGGRARVLWLELLLGPARRFRLLPSLDLDVAAFVAPTLVHIGGATAVSSVADVRQTWTARAGGAVRLQPRITRALRASVGVESALSLRTVTADFPDGANQRHRGLSFGAELGLVFTPP